ncbi:MAG: hypothetical protein HQ512_07280 [Rhodospirillales bacterium]|nr:hypothetical protein [Rhodospirillales bacterium]
MPYTLEEFAGDCKDALSSDPAPEGLEKVREFLETALTDEDFLAETLGPEVAGQRNIIYEDPDLGFCIIAHVYEGPKGGFPHDHGPAWAIYGQAEGVTEMNDWKLLKAPKDGKPGKVEHVQTYTLEPGDARVYQQGDIHSPSRKSSTKLIRIEGQNMDNVTRDKFDVVGKGA